jgi:hypothetical protein
MLLATPHLTSKLGSSPASLMQNLKITIKSLKQCRHQEPNSQLFTAFLINERPPKPEHYITQGGNACHGQTLYLIGLIRKLPRHEML